MIVTETVRKILSYYEGEVPGVLTNLVRILMAGKLGGTGKIIVLPVDQGFEHGPIRSFEINQDAYDPHYHFQIAIEAGLSAYSAPLGMLEAGATTFAGSIPMILKLNSANGLLPGDFVPDQAVTASVMDAVRLGCCAVGFTIYPGGHNSLNMIEQASEVVAEAKSLGLPTMIWAYPRGGELDKKSEAAVDVISYAAHIAALTGAHIIKVKLPEDYLFSQGDRNLLEKYGTPTASLHERVSVVVRSCFNSRRMVIFSGGNAKEDHLLLDEVRSIVAGGGHGSIIGRNTFQRPKMKALELLQQMINIYRAPLIK